MRFNKEGRFSFEKHKDSINLGFLGLIIILNVFRASPTKTYVLLDGRLSETPELDKFCTGFINQIINKKLQEEMVEPDIYEVLIQDNYKILNLLGNETALFSRAKDNSCAVVIKDRLGLRRFEIQVNKSFDYPFYYRVQKVDEPLVEG